MKFTVKKTLAPMFVATLLIITMLGGCASQGGQDYTRSQERGAMQIQRGVVTDVRVVQISEDSSLLGPTVGGVAGGFLGSLLGSGSGQVLGTIGGAAAGALGGAAAEKAVRDKNGYQITVRLDNGNEIAVVQDQDIPFQTGDRVRVLSGSGATRVQHE
ncbi:MAG: glycine zipper 2TM domain-containing protein [Deltaproteobacteria bacterium]|jgi:outer membrane lipoprotein SlyB|nr:glycine zipper 2TM domain-containing protein [Deltaproteobacteria bacterium]